MSIQQKVAQLAEMFPNHRRDTIEGILMEMNGDIENATSILLDTPENAPPPPVSNSSRGPPAGGQQYPNIPSYQPPYGAPPPYAAPPAPYGAPPPYGAPQPSYGAPQPNYGSPYGAPSYQPQPQPARAAPKPKPKPANLPKFDHIFSNDFLRWPEDAEVVRVSRDGTPVRGSPAPAPAPAAPQPQWGVPPAYPGAAPSVMPPAYPGVPGIGVPVCDPNDDPVPEPAPQINIDSNLIPGVSQGNDNAGWWANFKSRFSGSKSQENQNYQKL